MAQRSRETPTHGRRIAAAAILASTVMCGRLLALVLAVKPSLVPRLAIPVGARAAVGLALAFAFAFKSQADDSRPPPRKRARPATLVPDVLTTVAASSPRPAPNAGSTPHRSADANDTPAVNMKTRLSGV